MILFSCALSGPASPLTGSYRWIRVSLPPVHIGRSTCVYMYSAFTWKLEKCNGRYLVLLAAYRYVVGVVEADMAASFLERTRACLYQFSSSGQSASQSLSSSFLPCMSFCLSFLPSYFLKRERNRLRLKRNIHRITRLVCSSNNSMNNCT